MTDFSAKSLSLYCNIDFHLRAVKRAMHGWVFQTMFSAVVAEEVGRVTVVVAGFGSLGAEVTLAASRL